MLNFKKLNTTSSTVTLSFTAFPCAGPTPTYRVQAASMSSGAVTVAQQLNSTVYEISSLMAAAAYDIQFVDIECPSIIVQSMTVVTDMDSSEL